MDWEIIWVFEDVMFWFLVMLLILVGMFFFGFVFRVFW